jgi:hypothetical protein
MTKRTRRFLFVATGILVAGLGTGLVAAYMGGIQNLVLIGGNGPAELQYVPSDASMVAYADVRQVMDSEVRQKLMKLEPGSAAGAEKFKEETGIDIQTDVDKVVASVSGDTATNQRPFVLVRGRFDNSRIESLARQKGGIVEEYKGTRLISHPESEMSLGFVEPGLIGVGTPAALRRAIDTKAGATNITDNAEIMRLLKGVEDGNAWAVARFDALTGGQQLPADLAKQLPPINWFAASGHIDGGVRGLIQAETRDEAAANDLREVIRGFIALARMQTGQRAEFADLMNSLQIGGEGKTVSLGFAVPAEMIDALGAMHAARPRLPERGLAPNQAPRRPLPPTTATPAL